MRIAIDARFYGTEHSGLGRYTINLLQQLQEIDQKNSYYLLLRKKYLDLSLTSNFHVVDAEIPHYSLKEQIAIPKILADIDPDLYHTLHLNAPILTSTSFMVTIHDLIKSHFRGKDTTTRLTPVFKLKQKAYDIVVKKALTKSILISVPSNFVKQDILKNYPSLKSEKIRVVKEAPDPKFLKPLSLKKARQTLKKASIHPDLTNLNYILYVGSAYPHKNLPRLIQAFASMENKNLKLVMVTNKNYFLSKVLSKFPKKIKKQIIILQNLSDQALHSLYKLAKATVTPSLMEGFGLVGLESLASETPVIASDIPVYKEIYADSVFYADPENPQDIAQAIQTAIKSTKKPSLPKNYSWKKLAKETLKLYDEISSSI